MQGAEGVSTALALDGVAANKIAAHFTLTTASKLTLEFSSAQEFDAAVVNSAGKEVFRWSAGRMFAEMLHSVDVVAEKQWPVTLSPTPALPPGKYVLRVWLTTMGQSAKPYSATVSFEVTQ